jgi:hypothetical protein
MITFQDIEQARSRIEGAVYLSPCPSSIPLSELTGMQIYCKLDNLQRTGSFKGRGTPNALAQLPPEQQERGVIAASAGNHALGLAYQGKLLGVPVTVVMPKCAPLIKLSNCQKLGATVVLNGKRFSEAKERDREIAKECGYAYIDGYDDPAIIAGQERWVSRSLSEFQISMPWSCLSEAQIASAGGSIKQVVHDRAFASSDVTAVHVLCTVETRDKQHLSDLRDRLKEHGVKTFDSSR